MIHRGDLQAVLIEAVRADPRISLELDARIDDYAVHGNGVTVAGLCGGRPLERHGIALIGADGLWSSVRRRLGHHDQPAFARHTAWRALVAADAVVADLRLPAVSLWLGRNAHLVHYPVQGGSLVNVVAIIRDDWREPGWHAPGDRRELLERYPSGAWLARAGAFDGAAALAQMGALRSRPDRTLGRRTGHAPGRRRPSDAALSRAGRRHGDRGRRRPGDADGGHAARPGGRHAKLRASPPCPHRACAARGTPQRHRLSPRRRTLLLAIALAGMGGERLIARYDWLYGWKPG